MKKKILFAAACITGSTLFAQLAPPLRGDSTRVMENVLINVTKFPQKQTETGKVITVITKEQLQKSAGKTLSEILNQQAGIIINGANNSPGTNQSVYTRGAHAANTLILVDGVPIYDASGETSQFDIVNFSLYNIERIEIMKGAQSTLYGSDAVAGVINIITKKSGQKKLNLDAILSSGSYRTGKGFISASGKSEKGHTYFLSYSSLRSDGFSSAWDSTGKKDFDKDGFKQEAGRAAFGTKLSKDLTANVYGNYSVTKADIDAGAFADDKDFRFTYRNLQTGASLKYLLQKTTLHLNYNFNRYKRIYIDDSLSIGGFAKYQDGKYLGISHFAEVYGNSKLNDKIDLLAGIDYRNNATDQSYMSISSYGPFTSLPLSSDTTNTKQISTYASLIFKFKNGFNAEAGGRWNHHNVYGDNFTYSFNPFYFENGLKIFANLSSGFRTPSLYQLYSEFGNQKLEPETSVNFEAGLQIIKEKINARAVAFTRNIKNVFFFYTNPATYASMYINEDRQKDHGVEAEVAWNVCDNIKISSNYTWIKGKLSTKDFSGKDTTYENFYRKPSQAFNFSVSWQLRDDLLLMSHFKTVSEFYEAQYAAAPITMKGYYTVDFYVGYTCSKNFKMFIDLQNLTNQQYFDIRGFNSKRFNMNGGLFFNF